MADSIYLGKAALTLVRANGTLAYVHAGEPVPDGASQEELDRLEDEGFIVSLDAPKARPRAAKPEPQKAPADVAKSDQK